jgi:hypothetical protein
LEAHLGLNGVVWLTAVVIAAVFAGTFRLMLVRGTNMFVAVLLILLAISSSMIHFLARPHVLSWFFTLGWFWILDRSEVERFTEKLPVKDRWWLWLLPLSMVLWVNLHGGFLLAFVLLAFFWVNALRAWITAGGNTIEGVLLKTGAGRISRTDSSWITLRNFSHRTFMG